MSYCLGHLKLQLMEQCQNHCSPNYYMLEPILGLYRYLLAVICRTELTQTVFALCELPWAMNIWSSCTSIVSTLCYELFGICMLLSDNCTT